jgi:hypothetical protein
VTLKTYVSCTALSSVRVAALRRIVREEVAALYFVQEIAQHEQVFSLGDFLFETYVTCKVVNLETMFDKCITSLHSELAAVKSRLSAPGYSTLDLVGTLGLSLVVIIGVDWTMCLLPWG